MRVSMSHSSKEKQQLKAKVRPKSWIFAAVLLAQPFAQALALGLGELQYSSYLGSVLNAEIDLISRGEDYSADQVAVRQVGEKRASELGIELISSRYQFDFNPVVERGKLKIKLKSRQVVTEPFINILVELQWPKGSVYREYTFLLDPPPARPELSQTQSSSDISAAASDAGAYTTRNVPRGGSNSSTSSNRNFGTASASPDLKPGSQYRVQPGDTLSGIAKKWAVNSSYSQQDAMNWLFTNNQQAFVNGNINRLKAGVNMRLPAQSDGRVVGTNVTPEPQGNLEVEPEGASKVANSTATEPSGEGVVKLANPAMMTVEDLRNMNLTDATAKAMQSHIDATREVIDKLSRDNEDMRERLQNIEDSEYLDLLKQLVIAQKQQIEELRSQARELAGMEQGTSIGGSSMPVNESVDGGARAQDAETLVIESTSRKTAVDIDSATGRALEQGAGNLNPWLVFLSALWVPVILIGGFIFWRRGKAQNTDVNDHLAINTMLAAEEKALKKKHQVVDADSEADPQETEVLKAKMQSVLDQGLDINPEDADFLMGSSAEDLPEDINALDESASPDDYADINRELMEAFELNDDPQLQEELEVKGRLPDEQLKAEIRKKTSGYQPEQPKFEEYSFDDENDEFELEIDPTTLAEDLDEVTFTELNNTDETDDIIQKALIYTTYGRYNEAESLLLNQQAAIGEDPRIKEALADVQELKEKDKDL